MDFPKPQVSYFLNNQFRITAYPHEMKMTHWVMCPVVENLLMNTTVLDLSKSLWDIYGTEDGNNKITLKLRKYPGIIKNVFVTFFLRDVNMCLFNQQEISVRNLETELEKITN